jgi:nucleoside-diphosphate-sugar epimerase
MDRIKILITGANGYLGKSLAHHLSKTHEVVCTTRNILDVTDINSVTSFLSNQYFDVVLHCAISGGSRLKLETYQDMDNNLISYYNLLLNRNYFGKFISFGSGAEIYAHHTPYGMSKNVIAKSISEKENFYNIRIFAIFDENELDTRFIKSCIVNCINNKNINIHQDKFFDFFYMEDFLKIIDLYLAEKITYKNFDCCYKEKKKLSDIAKYICNLFEKSSDDFILKLNDNIGESYTGNFTELNNIHFIGLNEGINRVSKILRNSF